jgi:5-methylcytosine-specific restriction endonuclease McrA
MNNEVWKRIAGYQGFYEASSLGRIRSNNRLSKNRIMTQYLKGNGYLQVALQNGSKTTYCLVSRLIFETFNGKTALQIDHINEVKTDNRLENLQALSCSDNNIKSKRHNKTSKYPGVHKCKSGKWRAQMTKQGKKIGLGYFVDEDDAYKAYLKANI